MEFFYLNTDGTRAPRIVPDVLEQVAAVFDQLEVDVFQMAFPTKFVGFDDEPLPEGPTGQCTRCQAPTDAELLDEHGICDECSIRYIQDIQRTPPFARTDEDVKLLEALGYCVDGCADVLDEEEYIN